MHLLHEIDSPFKPGSEKEGSLGIVIAEFAEFIMSLLVAPDLADHCDSSSLTVTAHCSFKVVSIGASKAF